MSRPTLCGKAKLENGWRIEGLWVEVYCGSLKLSLVNLEFPSL